MSFTLTGRVERVTYESEETGFRVLKVTDLGGPFEKFGSLSVVGVFQAVGRGTQIRASGDFVEDPKHGRQFRADAVLVVEPSTLLGLERYLGSGLIPGIGEALAKRIVAAFGMDSLKVLDTAPERLRQVSGIGDRRIEDIKSGWSAQRAVSNIMVLLQTHGASPRLAQRIFKHYGDEAARVVQRAPYRLAMEVPGVGFKTADRIARSLGLSGDHPERAQAGVLHELGVFAERGHVCVPRTLLTERASNMLEVEATHVEAAIDAAWASERVVVEQSGEDVVSLARLHRAETAAARDFVHLLQERPLPVSDLSALIEGYENRHKIKLAPEQRRAIALAARHQAVVITGGPGVGKTTILRAILELYKRARLKVRLAAPTGRAAKRLSEATGHDASTLHRLLEFEPRTARFQRCGSAPLETDAVIIDEASMIDIVLASALLQAVPKKARLLIVGDADQLQSVGPGAFLRDLLETPEVPQVRLNEVFRQAGQSQIVVNAHRILQGLEPTFDEAHDSDFYMVRCREPERAAELILKLVTERIPARFGFEPRREIQVLSPMHRGPAGTQALNQRLQVALNPSGTELEFHGQIFRVGDKVMQTKNDYEREVFNGDLGIVTHVDPEATALKVRFDDREVACENAELDALVLGYATTVHKSQGSEYQAVVMPLLTGHFVMLSRNLVYTAVTRAKRLCVLVCDPRALRLALAETKKEQRMTRFSQRLKEALS